MNDKTEVEPEIEVYCHDCEVVLYSAVANWITNAVAQDRAVDHAEAMLHKVIIYEEGYIQ